MKIWFNTEEDIGEIKYNVWIYNYPFFENNKQYVKGVLFFYDNDITKCGNVAPLLRMINEA